VRASSPSWSASAGDRHLRHPWCLMFVTSSTLDVLHHRTVLACERLASFLLYSRPSCAAGVRANSMAHERCNFVHRLECRHVQSSSVHQPDTAVSHILHDTMNDVVHPSCTSSLVPCIQLAVVGCLSAPFAHLEKRTTSCFRRWKLPDNVGECSILSIAQPRKVLDFLRAQF
jgi:hypothetical protein